MRIYCVYRNLKVVNNVKGITYFKEIAESHMENHYI